ncbi:hypothetical protein M0R45_007204 [Rubus argutus]|uniref:Uncharacterized protein n=1 Tax=Rubus argutus TaxID=59490 RepID=A0AAW1XXQ7_RUBAR
MTNTTRHDWVETKPTTIGSRLILQHANTDPSNHINPNRRQPLDPPFLLATTRTVRELIQSNMTRDHHDCISTATIPTTPTGKPRDDSNQRDPSDDDATRARRWTEHEKKRKKREA